MVDLVLYLSCTGTYCTGLQDIPTKRGAFSVSRIWPMFGSVFGFGVLQFFRFWCVDGLVLGFCQRWWRVLGFFYPMHFMVFLDLLQSR